MWLGRPISAPWRMLNVWPGASFPLRTRYAPSEPAAEPVAASSYSSQGSMPREKALPLGPRAAVFKSNFHWQDSRSRFLQDVNAAVLRRNDTQLREQEPSSNHGMTGQLELFFCGEDSQPGERFFLCRFLNEDRLREIHFARDGEHLVVCESVAVGKHREGVAFEAVVGENVE